MIKLLTFTTLYPNGQLPSHGVFVENRLKHLISDGSVVTKVVAPVPYVPQLPRMPGHYAVWGRVPSREERRGIELYHPRYVLLPKVSMLAAPASLYLAGRAQMSALWNSGYEFDLIDAHYFYPDGVAAILLGRHFRKPVTITARGSDIGLISQYRLPRKMIRWAAAQAAGLITVCESLKTALVALGVPAGKIRVLRNGVDLSTFRPVDRDAARRKLRFEGATLLSVGHLIPRKGHDLAIEALAQLPDKRLVIVGDGPERAALGRLAERRGVAERVRFEGRIAHEALCEYYASADLTLLLSTYEGWANVLLESMACGTPVVATDVGGTAEVIGTSVAGQLILERSPTVVARAVEGLLARRPDRHAVRAYAEGFSWDATTRGQLDLFTNILDDHRSLRGDHGIIESATREAL